MTSNNISFGFNRKRNNNRKLPIPTKNPHLNTHRQNITKSLPENLSHNLQKVEHVVQNNLEHEIKRDDKKEEEELNIHEYIESEIRKQVEEQVKKTKLQLANIPIEADNNVRRINADSTSKLNQLNQLNKAPAPEFTGTYDTWLRGNQYTNIYYEEGPVSISTNEPKILGNTNNEFYDVSFSTSTGGLLGDCVSSTMNGRFVVAGEPSYKNNKGRVIIYHQLASQWEIMQTIEGVDENGFFGDSISTSENLLAIGQPGISSIYVYVYNSENGAYKNFPNRFFYNIGSSEASSYSSLPSINSLTGDEIKYQFGHSISISKYPNTNDTIFSLITGDPINGSVLYWKNGGVEEPGVYVYPYSNPDCETCMYLGYAVKTIWLPTQTTYNMPCFFMSNPDDSFKPVDENTIVNCGSVKVITYPNILVPDQKLEFTIYSPHMTDNANFGYSIDANPELKILCVSSPSIQLPNSGGTGIVETFTFEVIEQTENENSNPLSFETEVYKVAPDISYNGSVNFGNSIHLDSNSFFLSVGAPTLDVDASIYANTFVYSINNPKTKGGSGSSFSDIQNQFTGLTFKYDTSYISPLDNDNRNDTFGDAVSIVGINETTYNLIVGSPESFDSSGVLYSYSNLDRYYDLNIKGDVWIDNNLDISNDLNVKGNLSVNGNINIKELNGNITLDGSLNIVNEIKAKTAYIENNVSVGGEINLINETYDPTKLTFADNASIEYSKEKPPGPSTYSNSSTESNLVVETGESSPPTMSIYSDRYVNFIESNTNDLIVSMDLSNKSMHIDSNLDMSGNLSVNGTMDISGDIILNNTSITTLIENIVPTGSVFAFAGQEGPNGYVLCDGSSYSQTASSYKQLFQVIGTTFGSSDTSFNVPDLKDKFIYGSSPSTDIGQTKGNSTTTLDAKMIPGISGDFMVNHSEGRTPLIYDFSGVWTDASLNAQQTSFKYTDPSGVETEVDNAFGFMQGNFYGQVYPDVSYNKYNYVPVSTGADYMQPRTQVASTKVMLGESNPSSFSNTPASLALAYYIKL